MQFIEEDISALRSLCEDLLDRKCQWFEGRFSNRISKSTLLGYRKFLQDNPIKYSADHNEYYMESAYEYLKSKGYVSRMIRRRDGSLDLNFYKSVNKDRDYLYAVNFDNEETIENLKNLKKMYRAAIILDQKHNMPHIDIAEVFGVTESYVSRIISRARVYLNKSERPRKGEDE